MWMRPPRRFLPSLFVALSTVSLCGTAAEAPRQMRATSLEPSSAVQNAVKQSRREPKLVSVIVKFDADSVAAAASEPVASAAGAASTTRQLDMRSAASGRQLNLLASKRAAFTTAAARSVPRARVVHDLSVVLGGVSVVVPENEVEALRRLPGVQRVYRDRLLRPQTDTTPKFIGVDELWANGPEGRGQGVVVGILDSGAWPEHPSFSDPDPNGKPFPEPPATWTGTACEFGSAVAGDAPFACNNKLIGARRFMDTYDLIVGLLPSEFPSARDDNGHGTHTASTSIGNNNVSASVFSVPRGKVSGIAPRAHLAVYKVCGDLGCFVSDSAAAVQQAIVDGVNVINFSIGGGEEPYADPVSLAFLDAYNAGVFVAASAGNSGPGPDTVSHVEPWVTTVAASTEARQFLSDLTVRASNGDTFRASGASITKGISTATTIVDAAAAPFNDPLCQNGTADNAFAGAVVLCQRGVNARVEKSFNVQQRGGVGMILYNATPLGTVTDNHFVPTVHLEDTDGTALLAFLTAHAGETASFTTGRVAPGQPDVMASFSSRGGPGQVLGISKPDVTAPGVQVLAGNTPLPATPLGGPQGQLFQAINGTSMSSPHVAGAAAALKGLHPDWSPGQIKSALMLTAWKFVAKEDGETFTTPFDRGSGRIRVDDADNPGISISASGQDFIDNQANLSLANYPSLYVPSNPGIVSVERTLRSEVFSKRIWLAAPLAPNDVKVTVSPALFLLPAGGDQTVTITVDASAVPIGETRHANVTFLSGAFIADFPITIVRQEAPLAFTHTCTPATFPNGGTTNCTLSLTNPTFEPANVVLTDQLPSQLRLQSVNGATQIDSRNFAFTGVVNGITPPTVSVAPGSLFGYIPLAAFGVAPIAGLGDESIVNFTTPAFRFGGESNTRLGVTSNGYVVVGGGTVADVDFINSDFPDENPPNNVLAPFWTDLNPADGGAIRIGVLTDGVGSWIVVDYEAVPTYFFGELKTFQIWIGIQPTEDITFAYDPANLPGDGDLGFLTVGAENRFGNRGQAYIFDTPGGPTQDLRVTSGELLPGETKTITYSARGVNRGKWKNCARASSAELYFGAATACTNGEVTK
ncbi:subtilisin family serine protease [Povalibacter uvarum]|uniref:Subtilisin family serine protease n=1 Tax=Povalibacter uvarum TaxID=732238 RepID=A0A841HMF7_9GAMM|nr:S8 family serine peptidase [Povalibacter uvarum]MBB6094287.1 subtilisin family serine protease [Povalibacter uvarum]